MIKMGKLVKRMEYEYGKFSRSCSISETADIK